jgi:hypothetical protein
LTRLVRLRDEGIAADFVQASAMGARWTLQAIPPQAEPIDEQGNSTELVAPGL